MGWGWVNIHWRRIHWVWRVDGLHHRGGLFHFGYNDWTDCWDGMRVWGGHSDDWSRGGGRWWVWGDVNHRRVHDWDRLDLSDFRDDGFNMTHGGGDSLLDHSVRGRG